MSRQKKTRRLKGKLKVKTGSRKNFIEPGQKGKIPAPNRLAKHQRQPSAYEKSLAKQANLTQSELSDHPDPSES